MTNSVLVEEVQRLYGALLGGDIATVERLLHDDFVATSPATLPYGGEGRGAAGLLAMLQGFGEHWSDPQFALTDFTSSDAQVVAHIDLTATSRKNGVTYQTQVVETWRFREGKFVAM